MLRKTIITGTIIALGLSLFAFGGCRQGGRHGGAAFMIDYLSEALDLTASQQAQLDEIRAEMFAKASQLRAQRRDQRDEFMALLQSEQIDAAQLKALVARHRDQMEAVIDLAVDRVVAFHGTLSTEQKEKLVNKIEKFHRLHGKGFE